MKIGFDAKRAFNNRRGLGNYSRDTIRVLSEQVPENRYFMFTPHVNKSIHVSVADNCKLVVPSTCFDKTFPSLWRGLRVCKDIAKERIDVFHGLSHELPLGIEKVNVRKIVTMHDLIFMKFPTLYPLIDRCLYKKKYLHSCQVADTIIAVSEQTKRDLIQLAEIPEEKIVVVYQGCNGIFQTKVATEDKERIRTKYHLPMSFMLQVGAIEKRKNQEIILQAMHIGKIDCPLVLVGMPTAYMLELQKMILQYGLEKKVFILSDVMNDDLPALYQSAALFLYPSIFEGFGIPILEALWSGIPVIAASGSCLEESGGPYSHYAAPHDSLQWASEITKVLGDNEVRNTMIQNNREHLLQFTDETIASNLMKIYRK